MCWATYPCCWVVNYQRFIGIYNAQRRHHDCYINYADSSRPVKLAAQPYPLINVHARSYTMTSPVGKWSVMLDRYI
jgi:hypothetical protein